MGLQELSTEIRESLSRHGVPGAVIGFSSHGQVEVDAIGYTSLEEGWPVTINTLFRIASITKPMTATLAMTLVEEGLIDLDTPVATYIDDFPWVAGMESVTMRHLLSHTAGIDCELPEWHAGIETLADAVAHLGALESWAAPGSIMSYGNTGFWLAGHVISTVTGQSFEDAMKTRVFEPLGLQRTVFTAEDAIIYPVALGHRPIHPGTDDHETIRSFAYPRPRRPSGGVISTVPELLRFGNWHLGVHAEGPAVSMEHRQSMTEPVIRLRAADEESWGIGWNIRYDRAGETFFGHGGSYGGYQTQLTLVPSHNLVMAVLTNSAQGSRAIREIESLILADIAGVEVARPNAIELSEQSLHPFEGQWNQPDAKHRIWSEGDALAMDVVAREPDKNGETTTHMRLHQVGEQDFMVIDGPYKGTRADFIRNPETGSFDKVRIGLRVARRTS